MSRAWRRGGQYQGSALLGPPYLNQIAVVMRVGPRGGDEMGAWEKGALRFVPLTHAAHTLAVPALHTQLTLAAPLPLPALPHTSPHTLIFFLATSSALCACSHCTVVSIFLRMMVQRLASIEIVLVALLMVPVHRM